MSRKAVSGTMLTLLLLGISTVYAGVPNVYGHEGQVGVKTGDWIRYNYTVVYAPPQPPLSTWDKLEFLSVEGTNATIRYTTHLHEEREDSSTWTVDVVTGYGARYLMRLFVIPANSTVGDPIHMPYVTIAGENTRTYAGASRTVVYTNFSFEPAQITCWWDKQTGVLVELHATYDRTGEVVVERATATNMWQATPFWMQWWFYAIVVVVVAVIVASVGAVYFLKHARPNDVSRR